jgi:outer membrane protein assembly factor BamD
MTMLNLSLRRVAALAFLTTLAATASTQTPAPAATPQSTDVTLSNTPTPKKKVAKTERVQQSKDTKAAVKKDKKIDPIAAKDAQLPDKQLYDKALAQQKSGHFDIARLDLQTLLNTYPDSQYQMKAKLAVADTWYREGGSAALTQAEQEYNDFITFFPTAPEAAEAQMRVGDIYFKQMDVPDRDYQKGIKAQDAYRTMLKVYPDAPAKLLTECKQKLREVQEVLATREAELAAFYATHSNWPATIARYQTVIDTYPQYSHMDDALIGLGDAYEAEATIIRSQPGLPEGARAELLQKYDGQAADAYRKVVLYHYAAPHVEDAKERLTAMNLPIPRPTAEQVAASEALEGSRAQYTLRKKLELLVLHKPDTVTAAGSGEPPLEDAAPTTAPTIVRNIQSDYIAALDPKGAAAAAAAAAAAPIAANHDKIDTPVLAAPDPDAKPTLSDVAAPGQGSSDGSVTTMESAPASSGRTGTGLGVEVLTPGVTVGTSASDRPSATGAPDPNNGLVTVGPKNSSALPPVEKAADAPDQVNDAAGAKLPAAQVKDPNSKKKTKAPAVDKTDESSSKKKPKKGLDKLNPF